MTSVEDIFGPERSPHPGDRGANGSHGMNWIRPERRLALYMRDGWECAYCGRCVRRSATLDHVRPRARGGTNENRNLVTSCRPCNSSRKGAPLPAHVRARVKRLTRRKVPLQLAKDIRAGRAAYPVAYMSVGA